MAYRVLTALYYLGLAALYSHELDAVMQSEWRLMFYLRGLSDEAAYPIFVAGHFPAFVVISWLSDHRVARIRHGFRLGFSAFFVVHAALHFRLSGRVGYEFDGLLSNSFIYSAAAFGAAYVVVALHKRHVGEG